MSLLQGYSTDVNSRKNVNLGLWRERSLLTLSNLEFSSFKSDVHFSKSYVENKIEYIYFTIMLYMCVQF